MIHGSCHCGTVKWQLKGTPDAATACNCTVCRRYGTLWAYGWVGESVEVLGATQTYVAGDSLGNHFCPTCGGVAYWLALKPNDEGRRRIAVNLRLADPGDVADIPIRHFDGFESWSDLPPDGKCVRDYWV